MTHKVSSQILPFFKLRKKMDKNVWKKLGAPAWSTMLILVPSAYTTSVEKTQSCITKATCFFFTLFTFHSYNKLILKCYEINIH